MVEGFILLQSGSNSEATQKNSCPFLFMASTTSICSEAFITILTTLMQKDLPTISPGDQTVSLYLVSLQTSTFGLSHTASFSRKISNVCSCYFIIILQNHPLLFIHLQNLSKYWDVKLLNYHYTACHISQYCLTLFLDFSLFIALTSICCHMLFASLVSSVRESLPFTLFCQQPIVEAIKANCSIKRDK